ncbi:heparinase II/III domain-containing protein [Nocardioides aequoreus]|uniref:heparinase II/III domain-containing protein n=1 Tax=Nocardioides aequoreus TaxID=397278 RepID=UPI0004C2C695|nr:heparinase II/III family protein [Nocardioides aequoreus]
MSVLALSLALLVPAVATPRADAADDVPVTPAGPAVTTAVAQAPPGSLCDHSYSGLVPHNSLDDVRAGYYTGPPFQRVKVAVDGDVDWTLDPYQSLQWRMWLDTLGWAGPLLLSYDRTGNRADLELAMAYARDYVDDQPMDASTPDLPVLQQSSRRLHFLSCLYERDPRPWIAEAMEGTVDFLGVHWAGLYNHGLDQDNAIVVAGCVLDRDDWIELGRRRLSTILPVSIDDEGATNEQSSAYSKYTYHRWLAAQTTMSRCGLPPLPGLAERLAANYAFNAHATRPDGILTPIGDTYPTDRGDVPRPGTPLSGVWVQNGWAFGRSSWSPSDNPSHFSLRFGPGRQIHGHADHGSVTLYANGSPVITEPGSIGYTDTRRFWFRTASAKNVLKIGASTCARSTHARLLSSARTATKDRYVVETPHCGSTVARRAVSYTRGTGALTVNDTTSAQSRATPRQQLWHLVPGTAVTVRRIDAYRSQVRLTMPNGSTAQLVTTSDRRGASARAAAALESAKTRLARAERALRAAVRTKARPVATKARKRAVTKARAEVRAARRKAIVREDRGALQVSVVTGRTVPYQGWVSAGSGNPVPAPVIVVSQSAKAANITTTITPG